MVLPNVNPRTVDEVDTTESYFQRMMQYLMSGNCAEMLTALEAYKNHFLPRSETPMFKPYYQQWFETMRVALVRDIPVKQRLLVLDCLIHHFPMQDALPIVVAFFGKLSPEEHAEAKKQLQDVPELRTL